METIARLQGIDTLSLPEKKALRELITKLRLTYGSRLIKIILYGSKARGDFDKESDIDLLLVIEGPRSRFAERRKINEFNNEIGLKYDLFISVFPVDSKFFQSAASIPFYYNVVQEGIPL